MNRPGQAEKKNLFQAVLFSSSHLNLPFENKGFIYLRTIIWRFWITLLSHFSFGQKDLLHKERPQKDGGN